MKPEELTTELKGAIAWEPELREQEAGARRQEAGENGMLMAVQNNANQRSKHASGVRTQGKTTNVRASTLRAIHATWRKICDLEGDELREARLQFATRALNLKKQLKSTSKLTPPQLGRVLDEMRRIERAPGLPGVVQSSKSKDHSYETLPVGHETADIIHLATSAQIAAIEKLRNYLGWSAIGMNAFIGDKFKRASARFLTPAEANSCTMILLTIGARKRIADRRSQEPGDGSQEKISRVMIRNEIPALKRELGIDQRSDVRCQMSEEGAEFDDE